GNATGQELSLMRCTGSGQVFLAENEANLHPVELQGDALCVSAENVLAFDDTLSFGPSPATLHNLSVGPVEDLAVAAHASYGDGGLRLDLLGDADRYDEAGLARHHEAFCRMLAAFAEDPERPLGALPLVPAPEH
ncbi:hypothetical protein ADL27_40600, partial [Streptomyces sp. NRRL F-6602]